MSTPRLTNESTMSITSKSKRSTKKKENKLSKLIFIFSRFQLLLNKCFSITSHICSALVMAQSITRLSSNRFVGYLKRQAIDQTTAFLNRLLPWIVRQRIFWNMSRISLPWNVQQVDNFRGDRVELVLCASGFPISADWIIHRTIYANQMTRVLAVVGDICC